MEQHKHDLKFVMEPEEGFDDSSNKKWKFFQKNNKTEGIDKKNLIIKIVAIVSAVCLVLSSSVLVYYFVNEKHNKTVIETAQNSFDFNSEDKNDANEFAVFDELKKQNADINAWITIPGTIINYPVYKTDNNDFYLNHNMLKEKSRYGALFFDYRNVIEAENHSQNLTIYGHNMKDKSMFGSLEQYKSLEFYKEHPIIQLKTLYDKSEYIIFSVMVTNASASDDNGNIFNYTAPAFDIQDNFLKWTKEAEERSLIKTDVEIYKFDEILTLSTCCYDFNNARFVIMAKKLTEDDNEYDPSSATLNPNVKYPQVWYDKKGLEGYKATDSEDEDDDSPSIPSVFRPVWSDLTSAGDNGLTPQKPSNPSSSSESSDSTSDTDSSSESESIGNSSNSTGTDESNNSDSGGQSDANSGGSDASDGLGGSGASGSEDVTNTTTNNSDTSDSQ